jgi:hypothetical protein
MNIFRLQHFSLSACDLEVFEPLLLLLSRVGLMRTGETIHHQGI